MKLLPFTVSSESFYTLNGFLTDALEHIPKKDEHAVVRYEGYVFEVLGAENNMVTRAKVCRDKESAEQDEGGNAD